MQSSLQNSGNSTVPFSVIKNDHVGTSMCVKPLWANIRAQVKAGAVLWRQGLLVPLPLGPHAEGLQALGLGQHAVEPLHQRHRLVNAHLDAA